MKKIYLILLAIVLSQSATYAQVPDFTETDCNGVTHHLYDELAAGNAIILNFCAGWCGPCRIADPKLEEVFQSTCSGTSNVKVYGMLFETNQQGVTSDCNFGNYYASTYNLTFPIITDVRPLYYQYVSIYGSNLIPAFYVIIPNTSDPANSTVTLIIGYPDDLDNLKNHIYSALAAGGFYPSFTVTGDLCSATPQPVTLTSNISSGNSWSTGSTSQSISVGTTDIYSVTATVGTCVETISQYVEFSPLPVAGIATINTPSVCVGGAYMLDYNVPAGFSGSVVWETSFDFDPNTWYPIAPADLGPLVFTMDIYPPGSIFNFRVKVVSGTNLFNQSGCIAYSNELTLTVNYDSPGPVSGIASISATAVCTGSDYTINYSGNEPDAVWQFLNESTGEWVDIAYANQGPIPVTALNPSATVNGLPGDKFRVKVNGSPCWLVSNIVEVQYLPLPDLPPTLTQAGPCSPVTLTSAYVTGNTWSTGSTTQTITISTSDLYWLTVSDGGCTNTGGIIIDAGAPSNDNLCDAKSLTLDTAYIISNICATTQAGEMVSPTIIGNNNAAQDGWYPDNSGNTAAEITNTVWFSFIAPNTGAVGIETYGFDTQIALYSSSNNKCSGALSLIAANDDGGTDYGSLIINYCLQKGKRYFVQVDGYGEEQGIAVIGVFTETALPAPTAPTAINGLSGTDYGYCNGGTYTFTTNSNNATGYDWKVSTGTIVSGQGTNTITVVLSNSNPECEVKVKGTNCKGTSSETKLKLKTILPKPSVSGSSTVCTNANTVKTFTVSGVSGATSYTWSSTTSSVLFSDGGIPVNPFTGTATSVTVDFAAVATGNREIKVTANNSCGSSAQKSTKIKVSNCNRMSDEETISINENTLSVYPNPANDELNISLYSEISGTFSLRVISMNGQVVISDIKNVIEGENKFLINLNNLASGLYTVILQSDNKILQTRIVKE